MYNLSHIKVFCLSIVRENFPNENDQDILRKLSKCLGYKKYSDFKDSYQINRLGEIVEHSQGIDNDEKQIDISRFGFVFNVSSIMSQFSIKLEEALLLKSKIDSKAIPDSFDGNIVISELSFVKKEIKKLLLKGKGRIMAEYPFSFYTRLESKLFLEVNGEFKNVSFFYFDGFDVKDGEYFKHNTHLNYSSDLLSQFLKYDNVLFINLIYDKKFSPEHLGMINQLRKEYKNKTVRTSLHSSWEEAILFLKK